MAVTPKPMFCRAAGARLLIAVFALSCGGSDTGQSSLEAGFVRIDVDKPGEQKLLAYYFGGMLAPSGRDPFEAGILKENGQRYYLDVSRISELPAAVGSALEQAGGDGRIEWDDFAPVVERHYYSYRNAPPTTQALKDAYGDWSGAGNWFHFEARGVMSIHLRRIYARRDRIIGAVSAYENNGRRLIYEPGTIFVSEHVEAGETLEVSAMLKRTDGFWDFFAYGRDGRLTSTIEQKPTDLVVPTRCVGCHFGSKPFEPENSFPASPGPGPDGPREIYVPESMRNADVAGFFDEHRRRSDTVLGLYATLLTSELINRRENGLLEPRLDSLVSALGF